MVDFEHHPNCGGVMPCPCAELRTLRARVAEVERDARLGAKVRTFVGQAAFGSGSLVRVILEHLRAEEGGSDAG